MSPDGGEISRYSGSAENTKWTVSRDISSPVCTYDQGTFPGPYRHVSKGYIICFGIFVDSVTFTRKFLCIRYLKNQLEYPRLRHFINMNRKVLGS